MEEGDMLTRRWDDDAAPRTEEGEAIAGAAVPHEHPAYWDYVLR